MKQPTLGYQTLEKQKKYQVTKPDQIVPDLLDQIGSDRDSHQIRSGSARSSGSVAIQLAKYMERSNEPDKAETHDQHDRRGHLQTRSIIGVETEHVAPATASAAVSSGAASPPPSHASCRRSRAPGTRGHRARSAGACCRRLGLRSTSCHVWLERSRKILRG
jgi:hypothetical protein